MDKMKLQSLDVVGSNIEKIRQLFPNCVTERLGKDGKPELAIDFEKLQAELSNEIIGEGEERYQFTWPGKRAANRLANTPTTMTLRPCREESVDFDHTQNLYIEGDNLDVLKVLRETYLGKVKMIYIDPPYNTGNDFVYNDNFAQSRDEFKETSGWCDEEGNQTIDPMQRNTESNGRFHTDWLNMIYPRLKVARDLLSDNGVIFISIDDNEAENLMKICDEVFGESNFVGIFVWVKKKKGSHLSKTLRSMTEYILCYSRHKDLLELYGEDAYTDKLQPIVKRTNSIKTLKIPANTIQTKLKNGTYKGVYGEGTTSLDFKDFVVLNGMVVSECIVTGPFVWTQEKLKEEILSGTEFYLSNKFGFNVFRANQSEKIKRPSTLIDAKVGVGTNEDAYNEALSLFGKEGIMSYPKPVSLMTYIVNQLTYFDKDSIVLDFFSGSATTAHAVMQLNAEDGGNRKFIMVQLPEKTDETSEAYKAGYPNICEIGKERIRRAGQKIKEELAQKATAVYSKMYDLCGGAIESPNPSAINYWNEYASDEDKREFVALQREYQELDDRMRKLDTGFRVLKLDTSNMEEVYYTPQEFTSQLLFGENVKADRTGEDLLCQVMLDLGIELSARVATLQIAGKTVHLVDDNYLVACFDPNVTEYVITEIAKLHPVYFVMRDASAANDNVIDNFEQIFRHYSPDTNCRII